MTQRPDLKMFLIACFCCYCSSWFRFVFGKILLSLSLALSLALSLFLSLFMLDLKISY